MWPWDWIPMFCVNISFEGLLYKSWCEIQSSVHPSLAMSIVLKKALFSVVLSFLMPFALDRSGVYCYWGAHQLWLHHTQRVFASWPAIAIAPWMHNGWWRLCGLTLQHEGGIVRYPNHGIIWFCGAPLFFFPTFTTQTTRVLWKWCRDVRQFHFRVSHPRHEFEGHLKRAEQTKTLPRHQDPAG